MGASEFRHHSRAFIERCWFEKMEGYLLWKVVPPDYKNPFKPPVAEHILRELIQRRRALRRVCKLKCLCDGFEIMTFDNLDAPSMFTEHPCVSVMGINGVLNFLSNSPVSGLIEEQLDRIELDIRSLLEERESEPDQGAVLWGRHVTVREFRERRERAKRKFSTAAGEYRVRYESDSMRSGLF